MIRSSILTLFFALPSMALALSNEKCQGTYLEKREAIFNGKILTDSVEKFINDYENCPPAIIAITSTGGDAEAAMILGNWIFKSGIQINVPFICMSSCANYVFPAAKNKVIGSKALVIWHGSALQKDFRDFMEKYESLERTNEDPLYVSENALRYQSLKRIVKAQSEFYARIGVDEAIDRLGQEPTEYGVAGWSATTAVMEKYGIQGVNAAANYAEPEYLRMLSGLNALFKGKFMSFGLDSSGKLTPIFLDSKK